MQDAKGSGCRAPLPGPAALQYGGRILHSGSHQGAGVEAGNVGLGGSVRDLGRRWMDPERTSTRARWRRSRDAKAGLFMRGGPKSQANCIES